MCGENQTDITHVTLLGFGNLLQMKNVIFVLFLIIYIITFIGNALVISFIIVSPKLHSPMYIFLGNLSLCEILLTSLVIPNILYLVWGNGGSVPLSYCLSHCYLYSSVMTSEIFFLTVMAYDRYLAICNPLRYSVLMDIGTLNRLVITTWILGFLATSIEAISMCSLQFPHCIVIDHYVCDSQPIFEMSLSNTYLVEMEDLIISIICGLFPFALIIVSYASIFISVIQISTTKERQKTFSTCSSHLASVFMFFGAIFVIYLVPSELYGKKLNKVISLGYTVVTPLANPFIYSLRNREMKAHLLSLIVYLNKGNMQE